MLRLLQVPTTLSLSSLRPASVNMAIAFRPMEVRHLHNMIWQEGHSSGITRNLSFRYILFHELKTPNDAVKPQCQSQFTPKMKANAVPRLLLSLV